jgi:3-hydroxymyristoyl/3-hydroxydecanoyl-(acyl carrier protein) dehydratase
MTRLAFTFVVATDHPALPGHFPGRPVVPGVVLLDHVAEAARRAMALGPLAAVPRAKFAAPVAPGAVVSVTLDPRAPGRVGFTCRVGAEVVAAGDMVFAP